MAHAQIVDTNFLKELSLNIADFQLKIFATLDLEILNQENPTQPTNVVSYSS